MMMAVGVTPNASVGARREESFASGGAVNFYQALISADWNYKKIYSTTEKVMNTSKQVGARIMQESVDGSISFGITPATNVAWWRCGLGGTASPYSQARPLSSMVLHIDRDTDAIYTSGDMIASIDIGSKQGEELVANLSFEGKGYQTSTALSPTYTSGDTPFLHSEGVFSFGGTADSDITEFAISINNNLITDLFANQKTRRDIPATKGVVTGNFTRLFQNTTEYNTFIAELPRAIIATYSRGSNQFILTLNKVRYVSENASISGQSGAITEKFEFIAYVDDASTENDLTITVS